MKIHKNAIVNPKAKIGKNVEIAPFAVVYEDVVIGDNSYIGPHAVIMPGTRIGKNCKVFPSAVIGAIPQDLKFKGEYTTVEIGDNTTIREFVTINRGTQSKGKTVVGNNVLLMAYVHIAHDCIIKDHAIIVNAVQIAGEVLVDEWAIIGGSSAVHQFVRIGAHAMISGGSLVRQDVPPFTKAAHEPLSYVGVNSIGLRRRGFSQEKINHIQDIYRILYLSGLNYSNALKKIEKEIPPSKERDMIIEFVRSSERGIMKGYKRERESN